MSSNISIVKIVLRIIVVLVLSIVWVGLIPIYGQPFGGCDFAGYATLELVCSSWPEFLRGFGFVLIWLAITPARIWLYVLVLSLLAVLSVMEQIRFGSLWYAQSGDELVAALAYGLPIITGGLVAFAMYFGIRRVFQKKQQDSQSNDR